MELQHKKRMESIDIKMDKIPFKSKGPSKEVSSLTIANLKINFRVITTELVTYSLASFI